MTASVLSVGDVHGIIVLAVGTLIAAAVVALCAYGIRALRESITTSRKLRMFVVPHFEPQTAEQIVGGAPDRTLPARIGDLEEKVDGHSARLARLEKAKIHRVNGGLGA